jgi:hypothetical protein
MGVLLYGPPGTGKSSSRQPSRPTSGFQYTIDLAGCNNEEVTLQFSHLPEDGCILLLEDIDSAGLICDNETVGMQVKEQMLGANSRFGQATPKPNNATKRGKLQRIAQTGVSVSCLLNLIDGVGAKEGRLLMMTTYRPDAMDNRLLRSGRVSEPWYFFSQSTKETAALTCKRMFGRYRVHPVPGKKLDRLAKLFGGQCPENCFVPADLQEYCAGYRGRPEQAVTELHKYIDRKPAIATKRVYDMISNPLTAQFDDATPLGDLRLGQLFYEPDTQRGTAALGNGLECPDLESLDTPTVVRPGKIEPLFNASKSTPPISMSGEDDTPLTKPYPPSTPAKKYKAYAILRLVLHELVQTLRLIFKCLKKDYKSTVAALKKWRVPTKNYNAPLGDREDQRDADTPMETLTLIHKDDMSDWMDGEEMENQTSFWSVNNVSILSAIAVFCLRAR